MTQHLNILPGLTEEEDDHFVQHGWIKIPNAIEPKYLQEWMADLWVRTGYDPDDKSTWAEEYVHMPHHRQVRSELVSPRAWAKIAGLCGGEDRIDDERERWIGDNFIINFGSAERSKAFDPDTDFVVECRKKSYHADNDWYRHFLDSSSTALTIVYCFTDIPKWGGGTVLCEDGLKGICQCLFDNPQGFDPIVDPTHYLCDSTPTCSHFTAVEAKAGDVYVLHGLLPHSHSYNYLHYARVITNPHINLKEPYNLNRADGNYSPLERTILNALGRDSIPEFHPTRDRKFWYSRNITFKLNKVPAELERMKAAAIARGNDEASVDSFYLKGPKAMEDFNRTNGLNLPMNEAAGLETKQHAA